MQITTLARVLSTLGGLALIGVGGYVNINTTQDYDMKIVVGALAAGTALAAWAFTPMLNERRRALALLALLGILAGETYGLIATSERLLASRNYRASITATDNQGWVQANAALEFAIGNAKAECATGRKARCLEAEARVDEKRTILAGTQVPVPVHGLADLLGLSPVVADLIPTLAGSVALNLLGFVLMTFGHGRPSTVSVARLVALSEEPTLPSDAELEQLRTLLLGRSRPMTNQEIADRLRVSKAEASKRVSKAVAAGLVKRERRGQEVAITLH